MYCTYNIGVTAAYTATNKTWLPCQISVLKVGSHPVVLRSFMGLPWDPPIIWLTVLLNSSNKELYTRFRWNV